jgi:hypothetical protein
MTNVRGTLVLDHAKDKMAPPESPRLYRAWLSNKFGRYPKDSISWHYREEGTAQHEIVPPLIFQLSRKSHVLG